MEQTVKISIIVPVHNDEAYLRICLNSIVEQTMSEIEIICIDDASTDSSPAILGEYAKKDSRFRIITYEQNMSASQARKDGCLKSRGENILFVDGDDYLLPRTCESLYLEMKKNPVDILHFGTYILNYSYMPQTRIKSMENFVEPLQEKLLGEAVFEGAFREKKYGFNLWNKFYNADLCKKSMEQIEEGCFFKAQDKYAFFAIALEAKSYRGIPDKYYVYRFGSGLTGQESLEIEAFKKYCTMGKVADAMERLLQKKGLMEKYNDVNEINRKQLLEDVLVNLNRLPKDEQEEGLEVLKQFWRDNEVQYVRKNTME